MTHFIAHVALVVREYDEAIEFFTEKLGFALIEDTYVPEQDKRWVLIAPSHSHSDGPGGTAILLARAADEVQEKAIGNQTGGRVFPVPLYRRFLGRLRSNEHVWCHIRPSAETRTLRHGRGIRGPIRKSLGLARTKMRLRMTHVRRVRCVILRLPQMGRQSCRRPKRVLANRMRRGDNGEFSCFLSTLDCGL